MDLQNLNEQDILCVTRLLQSAIHADSILFGCNYCRYRDECMKEFTEKDSGKHMYIDDLRIKLMDITGIDLRPCIDPGSPRKKFKDSTSPDDC